MGSCSIKQQWEYISCKMLLVLTSLQHKCLQEHSGEKLSLWKFQYRCFFLYRQERIPFQNRKEKCVTFWIFLKEKNKQIAFQMKYFKYLHCLECGMYDKLVNEQRIIHLYRDLCLYVKHRCVYIGRARDAGIERNVFYKCWGAAGHITGHGLEITKPGIKTWLCHQGLVSS